MIPGNTAPSVSAGLARAYFDFAAASGAGAAELAARAQIDPAAWADPDVRVPMACYQRLVRAGKALTGKPGLPIWCAEATDLAEFSVVGLLANAATTMGEALEQLNRYGLLAVEIDVGPGPRFVYESHGGALWLVDRRDDPDGFYELTESTFTRMICHPRRFLPKPFVHEAFVTHPEPAHRAVYEAVWRCPVTFGAPRNALRTDLSLRDVPLRPAPAYAFGALSTHAERLIADLRSARTTRGRVEQLLMPILHTGEVSMEAVAGALGQSRQTLYRNLRTEGVTFAQVLDDLRRRLALDYLETKRVSVNETAFLVGFSDRSAFSRAFKRWTGKGPAKRG